MCDNTPLSIYWNLCYDEKNQKVTYVTFAGLEKSKEDVASLSNEAIALLKELSEKDSFLEQLIVYLIHRKN